MKYWDPGLNARSARTFIATVHINIRSSDWLKEFRKRKDQSKLSLAPNLMLNWVLCFLEAQCTCFSCFLKSHPPCDDQTRGSGASFPKFTDNFIAWIFPLYFQLSSLTCLREPVFSKLDLLLWWKVPASLSLFLKSEQIPALLYVGKGPEYKPFPHFQGVPRPTGVGHRSSNGEGLVLRPFSYT
jgi:hypothetical protein